MKSKSLLFAIATAAGIASIAGSLVAAETPKKADAAAPQAEMQLPPGWTMEDMQACMLAGTPGEEHKKLAEEVGVWVGKSTMWMMPGGEPMESDMTSTVTSILNGHFIQDKTEGSIPGMGPYSGLGTFGFDNVTGRYVSTWIDSQSTGMMVGTGTASADGKTLTFEYEFSCPVTKEAATMKAVQTHTGPNTKTFEMFGPDPKSGEVFRMMKIEYTRKKS